MAPTLEEVRKALMEGKSLVGLNSPVPRKTRTVRSKGSSEEAVGEGGGLHPDAGDSSPPILPPPPPSPSPRRPSGVATPIPVVSPEAIGLEDVDKFIDSQLVDSLDLGWMCVPGQVPIILRSIWMGAPKDGPKELSSVDLVRGYLSQKDVVSGHHPMVSFPAPPEEPFSMVFFNWERKRAFTFQVVRVRIDEPEPEREIYRFAFQVHSLLRYDLNRYDNISLIQPYLRPEGLHFDTSKIEPLLQGPRFSPEVHLSMGSRKPQREPKSGGGFLVATEVPGFKVERDEGMDFATLWVTLPGAPEYRPIIDSLLRDVSVQGLWLRLQDHSMLYLHYPEVEVIENRLKKVPSLIALRVVATRGYHLRPTASEPD
jgi:hypothetical protein